MTIQEPPYPRPGPNADQVLLGIDVGGTKILGGLVSRQGEVLFEHRVPTRREGLLEDLVGVAKILASKAGSRAHSVGGGMTGHMDRVNGACSVDEYAHWRF